MVLNDLFDRDSIAANDPTDRSPRAASPPRAAATLACALIILGPLCAALVGLASVEIAGLLLVGLVLATTPSSSTCRSARSRWARSPGGMPDSSMSCSAPTAGPPIWDLPQLFVALALGTYVAGVTWFARQEADQAPGPSSLRPPATSHAAIAGLAVIAVEMPETAPTVAGRPSRHWRSSPPGSMFGSFRNSRADASKCASGRQADAARDRAPRRNDDRLQNGRPGLGVGSGGTLYSGGDAWPMDLHHVNGGRGTCCRGRLLSAGRQNGA